MTERYNIVLFSSIFGASINTLAFYFEKESTLDIYVMTDLKKYLRSLSYRLNNLHRVKFIDLNDLDSFRKINPAVCIIVNDMPDPDFNRYIQIHHGFGWKGDELSYEINKNYNIDQRILKSFAYNQNDKINYRHGRGWDKKNIWVIGECFSDHLLEAPINEELVKKRLNIRDNKIILYAPTWNHGTATRGFFWDWYTSTTKELFELNKFIKFLKNDKIFMIVRFHQKKRYKNKIKLILLLLLLRFHKNTSFHYLDDEPDPLPFLIVSDLLIGDFSSINTYMYILEKPVIHINPKWVNDLACFPPNNMWRIHKRERPGPIVNNLNELIKSVSQNLRGNSYIDEERLFVKNYFYKLNGATSKRAIDKIKKFLKFLQ